MPNLLSDPKVQNYLKQRGQLDLSTSISNPYLAQSYALTKISSRRSSQEGIEGISRLASLGQSTINGLSPGGVLNIVEQQKAKISELDNKNNEPEEGFFLTAREDL